MANNYKVFINTIAPNTMTTEDISAFMDTTRRIQFQVLSSQELWFSIDEGTGFGDEVLILGNGQNNTTLSAKQVRIRNASMITGGYYQIIAEGT